MHQEEESKGSTIVTCDIRIIEKCMLEHDRDEEACTKWDDLAEQDFTHYMTESEYFRYKQNWWISLINWYGNTGPLRNRSDFNEALSTLNRPHQESGEPTTKTGCLSGSISNGINHRAVPPDGGNGVDPGGLPKNSQRKSNK